MTEKKLRKLLNNYKTIRFDSKSSDYGFVLYHDADGINLTYADFPVDYEDELYKDIDDFFESNELDFDTYEITVN